jgi:hypothetical protein
LEELVAFIFSQMRQARIQHEAGNKQNSAFVLVHTTCTDSSVLQIMLFDDTELLLFVLIAWLLLARQTVFILNVT